MGKKINALSLLASSESHIVYINSSLALHPFQHFFLALLQSVCFINFRSSYSYKKLKYRSFLLYCMNQQDIYLTLKQPNMLA